MDYRVLLFVVLWCCGETNQVVAQAPETKKPAKGVANDPAEPLAKSFSREAAVKFLDTAAVNWTNKQKCFTCHTNYAYLIARPALGGLAKVEAVDKAAVKPADAASKEAAHPHQAVRAALEELVEKRWRTNGPRWDAEVVMSAAVLALNDAATTGKLHPTTRKALDRMWTVQKEHGGFDWLKCEWPPMESDDDFAIPMAALAAGAAPEGYLQTPAAQEGIKKMRGYLEKHAPPTLHHRAMLVWAAAYVKELVPDKLREETIRELREKQRPDGGWAIASLGNWKRGDKKEQDVSTSDGYGTGFVVFVLRQGGATKDDPAVTRGVAWLKSNQRESGRWHTRSLFKDNHHYISHAGTAFAMLAMAAE